MWNPVPFVDIVVVPAGTRVNKNGQRASSSQIQSGTAVLTHGSINLEAELPEGQRHA